MALSAIFTEVFFVHLSLLRKS